MKNILINISFAASILVDMSHKMNHDLIPMGDIDPNAVCCTRMIDDETFTRFRK